MAVYIDPSIRLNPAEARNLFIHHAQLCCACFEAMPELTEEEFRKELEKKMYQALPYFESTVAFYVHLYKTYKELPSV